MSEKDTENRPATIWIITQAGRVVPLADMPAGESAKYWTVEGSTHWQPGEPPGASTRQPATRRKVEAISTGAGLSFIDTP